MHFGTHITHNQGAAIAAAATSSFITSLEDLVTKLLISVLSGLLTYAVTHLASLIISKIRQKPSD